MIREFIFNLQRFTTEYSLTSGADNYPNGLTDVIIYASSGDDTVSNYLDNVTILGGNGRDSITNSGNYVSINSGSGQFNYITNSGSFVTIEGESGTEYIYNNGGNNLLVKYSEGDGNDFISGFNKTSTLEIGGGTGTYSSQVSGKDIIITVGNGSILLKDVATLFNDTADSGLSNIEGNYINPLLITLTEGNYTYSNTLEGTTILALGGKDSVYNSAQFVSISGGDGRDTFLFKAGEGNLVIEDYNYGIDTVMILSGKVTNSEAIGSDVVFTLSTDEEITLKNAASRSAAVVNASGDIIRQYKK